MGFFENLLEKIEAADREVIKKYPNIAEEINKTDELLTQWETWKKTEYDPQTGYTKSALKAINDQKQEIEALKLLQRDDVNFDEMKASIQKMIDDSMTAKGVIDRNAINQELTSRVTIKMKQPDGTDKEIPVTDYVRNLERGMEMTYSKSSHLPLKFYKEFGTMEDAPDFTQEALFKHMQENRIVDFDKGYESFVAPLKVKKAEAAAKVREEAIRKEERDKVTQEYMKRNGGVMPDDTRGAAPEMSALSRKIAERKKIEVEGPKLTPGSIGDGVAANDAYQKWLADQTAGVKPNFATGMIQ